MRQVLVAELGQLNSAAEVYNSMDIANSLQSGFSFKETWVRLPFDKSRYALPHAGYDLDNVVIDLFSNEQIALPKDQPVILLTSDGYSDRSPDIFGTDPLNQGLYFYSSEWIPGTRCFIASTFIWEHLPERPDIFPSRSAGRRTLQPYLLYCFAVIALELALGDIRAPMHADETLGCANDYNQDVHGIDEFFARRIGLCPQCNNAFRGRLRDGRINLLEAASARRLLNRAVGKPFNGSCFISYGTPNLDFARSIHDYVTNVLGMEVFFYPAENTPGDSIWREIIEKLGTVDKVLVVCSARSLQRDGFLREIDHLARHDPSKILPISMDDAWKQPRYSVRFGSTELKPVLLERNLIDFGAQNIEAALRHLAYALL